MSEKTPKSFTRRTFLTAGGFFITSMALPVVNQAQVDEKNATGQAGGLGLPQAFEPTIAYAKDSETTFEVAVTTESTIVFKIVDVAELASADSAKDLPIVAGAKVSCYDAASNKTYEATSDEHGFAYVDIAEGTKRNDDPLRPAYSANLTVSVSIANHRDVTLLRLRVQGATLYCLPSPTKKDETAYFRAIGFNGDDIQYSKTSFLHAATNDGEHTLSAQVYLKDGKVDGTVVHFYRWRSSAKAFPGAGGEGVKTVGTVNLDASKAISSNAADANVYKAELKGRFLLNGYGDAFETGDRLVVGVTHDNREYLVVTLAEFKKAPFDNTGTGNLDTLPGLSLIGSNGFKVPDKVPILGGDTFSWWQPTQLFSFNWSPFGYIRLSVTLGATGVSTDDNPFNLSGWKSYSFESAKAEYEYQRQVMEKRVNNVLAMDKQMTSPEAKGMSKYFNADILPKFTVGFGVTVYVDAAYDWLDTKAWRVGLGGAISLMGEALYDIQMMIGPVPVFVSFSLGLAFTLATKVGGVTYWPDGDDAFTDKISKFFGGMTLDWKNTQTAFTIAFSVSLSGGVGVAGVATFGLRYAASLTIYISFYEEAKGIASGTNTYPHTMVLMDMSLSVAVQFLLFKYNKTLWTLEGADRKLYDSWKSEAKAASIEDAAIAALADDSVPDDGSSGDVVVDKDGNYYVSLEVLAKNAKEVTVDELKATREFGTNTASTPKVAAVSEAGEAQIAALDADGVSDEGSTEYVYPDTGITVDEDSYASEKFISGDEAISGIAGIADDGGVAANSGKILSNVFSDGRPQFVMLDGVLTMFRIASVNCNGQMRTRLVVQRKQDGKWTQPAPVDFVTDLANAGRDDLYDYDFDIAPAPLSVVSNDAGGSTLKQTDVVILLFSGTRDMTDVANDPASRLVASSGQHVSTVLDYGKGTDGFSVKNSRSWRTFADKHEYGNNQIFAYMPCVSIEATPSLGSCAVFVTCSYAYKHLDKEKEDKAHILTSAVPAKIAYAATFFLAMFRDTSATLYSAMNEVTGGVFEGFDGEVVSLSEGPVIVKSIGEVLSGEYEFSAFLGFQTRYKNSAGKQEQASGVFRLKAHATGVAEAMRNSSLECEPSIFFKPSASVRKLVPWPKHDAMIAIKQQADAKGQMNNVAYSVTFDLNGQGGDFPDGTQIGPSTGIPMDFMVTDNGMTLLYADNQNAKNKFKRDANGNPVLGNDGLPVTEAAQGNFYRIMAMKVIKDGEKVALSKPFPACTLNHAIDSVAAVATEKEATDIVALEIADINKSQANYWEINVPCIACATPIDIVANNGMVIPGKSCTFEIGLRNDGNTILRGTELTLVDGETGAVLYDNLTVKFSADTVVASSDMRAATNDAAGTEEVKFETGYEALGDHILAKNGGRDVLAPGRFARVKAEITVPTTWKNKHKIVVKTSKLSYIDPISSEEKTTASLASLDEKTGSYSFVSGIAGLGDSDNEVRFGKQGDDAYVNVTLGSATGSAENLGYSEAVELSGEGGNGGDGDEGGNGGNGGSGNGGSGKKGTPETGDAAIGGIAGVAAAALGAIGLGMAAYSNRRVAVEREEADFIEVDATVIDDEDDDR